MIEEILARLPVKSLLRLRCVSKPWLSLISSKYFIIKHLKNSTISTSAAHRRVIFNYDPKNIWPRHGMISSYLDDESFDPPSYSDPTKEHLVTGRIMGCCNGMFCLSKPDPRRLILWNPATRISTDLPKMENMILKYGFGWDEESGAYKVFAKVCVQGEVLGKLYSSKTNSWKTVNPGSAEADGYSAAVFVSGKMHWLMFAGYNYIESFDLKREVFERMKLPYLEVNWGATHWLRERAGRLCLIRDYNNNRREMWVMEQYGAEESWVKVKVADLWQGKKITGNYNCRMYFYAESLVSPKNL